ncbi:MAG TPA: ATP-binding cassette domain-containing protein [Chitinophagaceae bacterium]|nr:ATP-binding cassette domain-containing protein [Chitinophagaceae bacterium]
MQLYQVYSYAFFKGVISLSLPLGIQTIINLIQGGKVSTAWLVLVFIIMIGIAFSGILQLLQLRITETIQQKIFTRAVFDFAYRIPRIRFEDIDPYYPPELMNRFFEVPVLQKNISKVLIDLPSAVLQILFGLIVLSFYHPFFISFSLFLLLLVIVVIVFTAKRGLETSIIESKQKFKAASWLEELARVKDTFKLAGKTDLPLTRMNSLATNYIEARESHFRILKLQYIILLFFKVAISASLLLVGGYLVLEQKMNIGQFVAAEIIILLLIDSSEKLILNFDTIYDVLTSLEKINEVTTMTLEKDEQQSTVHVNSNATGFEVELHKISFQYPGNSHLIINDSSTIIRAGERVCIAGENGSGKSTLLHLIAGLFKPTSGNILINKFHMENYDRSELYQYFGQGLVDEALFDGTLAENISLGRENISPESVLWATQVVGLDSYIKNLPEGISTKIELSGGRLPESIYNKIIIARSIVSRPKLLLLEIAMDSFEKEERHRLIDFLTDSSNAWTLIYICNDDYFKNKATQVLRIESGKITQS